MTVYNHRTETRFMYFYNHKCSFLLTEDEGQQAGDVLVIKETKDFLATGREHVLRIMDVERLSQGLVSGWCILELRR